ncbi:MAG: hypothetical protein B7Z08_06915 [Sphingomonadales bacterium 32-68-7]|nr:MAG: hypothetical protein B7Z33_03850 [Sphingomonadales bacterium 12-68-11]OYX08977.1 MAG: hypothetical protein B7Z08_06915 [Sphingomonadales bacterium 32-68-7]
MRIALLVCAGLACALPSAASAEADLAGFWSPTFATVEPDPDLIAKLPAGSVVIADTGAPEFPRMEFGGLKLTPEALEKARTWRAEDEMTLQRVCAPQSIVYAVQGPFPFEIDQTRDLIVFRYEYYDQVRLIFMDGRGHPPADAPHTKMGHSIGRWDGDELVVDTTHIAASTITNNGLDHSDAIHMVERYKLSADGTALLATQWFSDPAVLENTGARFIRWDKRAGQYVLPYECDPSFALEYQARDGAESGN